MNMCTKTWEVDPVIDQQLNAHLRDGGADMVGYAHLGSMAADVGDGLEYGIAIVVAFDSAVIAGIGGGPTHDYYAAYDRANQGLDDLGQRAAA